MRQLTRLIRYVAPYWWQFAYSVLLLAGVGFFEAFRLLLVGPVLDRVLNPSSGSDHIRLFTIPGSHHAVYLEKFVPTHFHNDWPIVAYDLVACTVLTSIVDYAGTYSVNHAAVAIRTRHCLFSGEERPAGAADYASRARQACRYSKYPARNHHRQSNRQSLQHGDMVGSSLPQSCREAPPGESQVGSGGSDQLSPDGYLRRYCDRAPVAAWPGPDYPRRPHARSIRRLHRCRFQLVQPRAQVCLIQ